VFNFTWIVTRTSLPVLDRLFNHRWWDTTTLHLVDRMTCIYAAFDFTFAAI